MKASIFFSLWSGITLVSATSLAENVLCGDSAACATRCAQGAFHIVQDDKGNAFFGCSQKANEYNENICKFKGLDAARAMAKSREVCDAAGGRFCPRTFLLGPPAYNCIVFAVDENKFDPACKGANGTTEVVLKDFPYEIITKNCPNS